jgi:hypothetical protein
MRPRKRQNKMVGAHPKNLPGPAHSLYGPGGHDIPEKKKTVEFEWKNLKFQENS